MLVARIFRAANNESVVLDQSWVGKRKSQFYISHTLPWYTYINGGTFISGTKNNTRVKEHQYCLTPKLNTVKA